MCMYYIHDWIGYKCNSFFGFQSKTFENQFFWMKSCILSWWWKWSGKHVFEKLLGPPTPGLLHQPLEEKEERPRWPTLSKSPRWFCGPAGLGSTTKIRDSESRWPPPDLLAPPTHSPLLRRSWGVYSNLNSSYLEVLDCMSRVTCKIEIKGEQHRALPIL